MFAFGRGPDYRVIELVFGWSAHGGAGVPARR
jgi:hypothetical protein